MNLKNFIYKLEKFSPFGFAQWKFLRKLHGGQWTKISLLLRDNISTVDVWVKGRPTIKYEKIVKTEIW